MYSAGYNFRDSRRPNVRIL